MELATLVTNRQSSFPASIQQTNHQNTLANWSNYEYERLNLQCLINYLYSPVQNCLPDNPKKKKPNFKFVLAVNKNNNKKWEREFWEIKRGNGRTWNFRRFWGRYRRKAPSWYGQRGCYRWWCRRRQLGSLGLVVSRATPPPTLCFLPLIDRIPHCFSLSLAELLAFLSLSLFLFFGLLVVLGLWVCSCVVTYLFVWENLCNMEKGHVSWSSRAKIYIYIFHTKKKNLLYLI